MFVSSRLCRFAALNRPAPPRIKFKIFPSNSNINALEGLTNSDASDLVSKARQLTINDLDPAVIDTNPKAMNKVWSKVLLSQYCKTHGLAYSGRKSDLIGRIREFWGITNDGNYGLTEVKLRPSEFFLVKGVNNQNIERISKIANVRITADDASNTFAIKGEVQGMLKTRQLISDYIKDIVTDTLKLPKSFSEHNENDVIDVVRRLSGAFAIKDCSNDELLIAAPMQANIQQAKQIIGAIKQTSRISFPEIIMDMPSADIGPSLAFYPSSDISWNPYHKRLLACRLRKLSSSLSDDQEECLKYVRSGQESTEYLNMDKMKQSLLANGNASSIEASLGHALFSDKLLPDSNPFLSVLSMMGNNLRVSEFKNWIAETKPYMSFLPASVSQHRILKYLHSATEPYFVNRYFYSSENSAKQLVITERDNVVKAALYQCQPAKTLFLNVNRQLDYCISTTAPEDITLTETFDVKKIPKCLGHDGDMFNFQDCEREKTIESDDGIKIAHVTSSQSESKTLIRMSSLNPDKMDKFIELVRKLT